MQRITRTEFYRAGGLTNPKLYRRQYRGTWRYYYAGR